MFTSVIDRVKIDGEWFDKYSDYPASKFKKALIIELPAHRHYKRQTIKSKYIVSKALLIVLEKMYALTINTKKADLRIYDELAEKYKVNVDTSYIIKKMVSQYRVMSFVLRLNKPKVVFVMPSYTSYGYIRAFKEMGVKVVELQHGVIVDSHVGYNLKAKFERTYFVDNLLTFGTKELQVFGNHNMGISLECVKPMGNFYLDYISEREISNLEMQRMCDMYTKTVSVSLQDIEASESLIESVLLIAKELDDYLFLMKPRRTSVAEYKKKYNLSYKLY